MTEVPSYLKRQTVAKRVSHQQVRDTQVTVKNPFRDGVFKRNRNTIGGISAAAIVALLAVFDPLAASEEQPTPMPPDTGGSLSVFGDPNTTQAVRCTESAFSSTAKNEKPNPYTQDPVCARVRKHIEWAMAQPDPLKALSDLRDRILVTAGIIGEGCESPVDWYQTFDGGDKSWMEATLTKSGSNQTKTVVTDKSKHYLIERPETPPKACGK